MSASSTQLECENALRAFSGNDSTLILTANGDSIPALQTLQIHNNWESAVLFTGRRSADQNGTFRDFLNRTCDCTLRMTRFQEIDSEPDIECVQAMIQVLRTERPDVVFALGGGSCMDAAKLAWYCAQTGEAVTDCFGSGRLTARHAADAATLQRIVAIPTTAGTGSEVTPYCNIVDRAKQVKMLTADPLLEPAIAFLSTRYVETMPRSVALATGCDALAHLLEGWLNVPSDPQHEFVNEIARCGVKLILENFEIALSDSPTPEAITAMQYAATLGGLTIRSKSTGLPHLGSFSWFGIIEHGIAVARLLPAAWRYYLGSEAVRRRSEEIAPLFGAIYAEEAIQKYEAFLNAIHVPQLRDYPALTEALLERTAKSASANPMKLKLAPRPIAVDAGESVLRQVLHDAMHTSL